MRFERKLARGIALGAVVGAAMTAIGFLVLSYSKPGETKTYALGQDILVHGNVSLKEVALTFDDGPRPEIVRGMLDTLGKHGVRATFFVVGEQVEKHPAIVRRMMGEGHEVANHTFSHPRLDGMDAEAIKAELAQCDKAVFAATGAHTNLFRPPGMRYDQTVVRAAQDLGYVTIHWNVAAQDFLSQDPSEIERKVLSKVGDGSVILLHNHPDTAKALPGILQKLVAKGYRFVTVSQMLGRLPRPVYVKTNAFGAKTPVASKPNHELPKALSIAKPSKPLTSRLPLSPSPDSVKVGKVSRGVDVPVGN